MPDIDRPGGHAADKPATFEARCRVVRRTRSLMFASAELVVGARVIATAKGVWKALGERPARATGAVTSQIMAARADEGIE